MNDVMIDDHEIRYDLRLDPPGAIKKAVRASVARLRFANTCKAHPAVIPMVPDVTYPGAEHFVTVDMGAQPVAALIKTGRRVPIPTKNGSLNVHHTYARR